MLIKKIFILHILVSVMTFIGNDYPLKRSHAYFQSLKNKFGRLRVEAMVLERESR